MEDHGRRASVVVLGSTINASVSKQHSLHRYNTIDLARIARSRFDRSPANSSFHRSSGIARGARRGTRGL